MSSLFQRRILTRDILLGGVSRQSPFNPNRETRARSPRMRDCLAEKVRTNKIHEIFRDEEKSVNEKGQ